MSDLKYGLFFRQMGYSPYLLPRGHWRIMLFETENGASSNSNPRVMKKFKILIVDDNDLYREALKETLQISFPMVAFEEVANGGEVLGKVEAFLPDLIFMDIKLPGENGLKLTKTIKTNHPNIIIFIITSYDIPEYREAAFKYGADRFLAKVSLNPGELKELVKSYSMTFS
jgi:CheY-like chemotaxis protein